MIQRIQSLLLLLAVVANLGVLIAPMWEFEAGESEETLYGLSVDAAASSGVAAQSVTDNPLHIAAVAVLVVASLFVLITIFMFNDRARQKRLVMIGVVLLMVEIGLWVFLSYEGPYLIGDARDEMAQWGFALPIVALLLTWFAANRIQKDIDLVRSMDRIR